MATYVIGDIQGCYDELQALLLKIQFDINRDRLWLLGDLVNRGPKSLETLRFLSSLPNTVCVLGNHDLHLIALAYEAVEYPADDLSETLAASDLWPIITWLKKQKLTYYDEQFKVLLVHAGIFPTWPLALIKAYSLDIESELQKSNPRAFLSAIYASEQACWNPSLPKQDRLCFVANCLTRIRCCKQNHELDFDYKGSIKDMPKGLVPWYEQVAVQNLPQTDILFGHWSALQASSGHPRIHALDGGCVWGGELVALRLEDRHYFSVKAQKIYQAKDMSE